ncbi:hypothetical protein HED60_01580 [Planctomycetales bacterium ZRK34]|nr:hypothetical protein HED60_01580 [Planctomycetales bacterium ZRK34]
MLVTLAKLTPTQREAVIGLVPRVCAMTPAKQAAIRIRMRDNIEALKLCSQHLCMFTQKEPEPEQLHVKRTILPPQRRD